MKRSSGVRTAATVAVSVLSLALVTGCSSEESGGAKASDAEGSSSPNRAAKALSAAELEKLLLAEGEIEGYKVASGDDTLPKSKSEVKTDKAECGPLAWAMAGLAPGDTDTGASNTVTADPASDAASESAEDPTEADLENAFSVNMTFVGLSSYEGDGAEQALKAVSDGIAACAGGFTITAQGETQKITKVSSEQGSAGGDESVAFVLDSDMDGEGTAAFRTQVVRQGNTVATYYTVDFATMGTGKAAEVPSAVTTAQAAKLK
ncbi:hypothetical protein AB0L99_34005 [Streptomyces sp. NPDC051954]|uniref:hypothetical protein n=1 Tax=unclassified Streptomyces TaxID=2593676 RepID=UPI003429644B